MKSKSRHRFKNAVSCALIIVVSGPIVTLEAQQVKLEYPSPMQYFNLNSVNYPEHLIEVDLDHDGRLEIVKFYDRLSGYPGLEISIANESYNMAQVVCDFYPLNSTPHIAYPATDPKGCAFGDFDGNGKIDIAIRFEEPGVTSTYPLQVFELDTSNPSTWQLIPRLFFPNETLIYDLDGDDRCEFVLTKNWWDFRTIDEWGIDDWAAIYKLNPGMSPELVSDEYRCLLEQRLNGIVQIRTEAMNSWEKVKNVVHGRALYEVMMRELSFTSCFLDMDRIREVSESFQEILADIDQTVRLFDWMPDSYSLQASYNMNVEEAYELITSIKSGTLIQRPSHK
ncbi:FG-GAP repeat domain-containing protein [Gemmatimonadota bacterium]